jgi:hypothetical protein
MIENAKFEYSFCNMFSALIVLFLWLSVSIHRFTIISALNHLITTMGQLTVHLFFIHSNPVSSFSKQITIFCTIVYSD